MIRAILAALFLATAVPVAAMAQATDGIDFEDAFVAFLKGMRT